MRSLIAAVMYLAFASAGLAAGPDAKALWAWSSSGPRDDYAATVRHVEAGGVALVCVGVPKVSIDGMQVYAAEKLKGYEKGYHVCFRAGGEPQCARLLVDPTAEIVLAVAKGAHNSGESKITPELVPVRQRNSGTAVVPHGSHAHRDFNGNIVIHDNNNWGKPHPGLDTRRIAEGGQTVTGTFATPIIPLVSSSGKPKRVEIAGKYYDRYPDGRLVECVECNRGR